jgi:hypothetical protein
VGARGGQGVEHRGEIVGAGLAPIGAGIGGLVALAVAEGVDAHHAKGRSEGRDDAVLAPAGAPAQQAVLEQHHGPFAGHLEGDPQAAIPRAGHRAPSPHHRGLRSRAARNLLVAGAEVCV